MSNPAPINFDISNAGSNNPSVVQSATVVGNFPVAQSDGNAGPPYYQSSYNLEPGVTLTPEQLAAVGYEGGFRTQTSLKDWIDLVYPQSGGSPGAIGIGGALANPPQGNDPEYSVGLSQINVQASPDLALGSLIPTTNALAAYQLYKQRGLEPWAGNAPPVPGDTTAVAQVLSMSPTEIASIANQADRQSIEGLQELPPPYAGTSNYPPILTPSPSMAAKGASGATYASTVLLAGVNYKVVGGVPAGTQIPPAQGQTLPGAATNQNLGGIGALFQQWDLLLNAPAGTYQASLGIIGKVDLSAVVRLLARAISAVPGLLVGLVAAGMLGFSLLGGSTAAKVLPLPGAK